jgi:hypothetical protein
MYWGLMRGMEEMEQRSGILERRLMRTEMSKWKSTMRVTGTVRRGD